MSNELSDSSREQAPVPGKRWRFLAHGTDGPVEMENNGQFDELVVDDWLHIEQMDNTVWWLRIGDARILVSVNAEGNAKVDIERGSYGPCNGQTVGCSEIAG